MESIDIPFVFHSNINGIQSMEYHRIPLLFLHTSFWLQPHSLEYPLILAVAPNSNAGVGIDLLVADLRNGGGRRRECAVGVLAICGTG